MKAVRVNHLVKKYHEHKPHEALILNDISLSIDAGEFCTIVGPSGSGKSTFLKCISGLETVTSGEVVVDDQAITKFTKRELETFKRKDISFVFQEYNLIDDLTLLENICLDHPLTEEINQLIDEWDLRKVIHFFPNQCSGGQQQKTAILRALIRKSKILFCDEPTGALDTKSSRDVLNVLKLIQKKYGTTIILITHHDIIKKISNKIITIKDGEIVSIKNNEQVLDVNEVIL